MSFVAVLRRRAETRHDFTRPPATRIPLQLITLPLHWGHKSTCSNAPSDAAPAAPGRLTRRWRSLHFNIWIVVCSHFMDEGIIPRNLSMAVH
jgi:hypothetical protein